MGYELITVVRFAEHQGKQLVRNAVLQFEDAPVARLTYGSTATIWRINLGWRRRREIEQYGFVLDTERGYWARNEALEDDQDDPMSALTRRVIPFVEDRRNCLLFEPTEKLEPKQMASLAAAFKNAIQLIYQLEDSELSVEPLPSPDERRLILFYEAAEGGAGVLRRLVDDPQGFTQVARRALELCHFDSQNGSDLRRAERAKEDCEAACYDCLMSYYNQPDHLKLDRHVIKELLQLYMKAHVEVSPVSDSRVEHLQTLRNLCQSDLEEKWLDYLEIQGYRMPTHAQHLIEACHTRPDFFYEKEQVVIYVDGYHHLYPERRQRDALNTECLEDLGYTVLRFGVLDEWEKSFEKNKYVFGKAK